MMLSRSLFIWLAAAHLFWSNAEEENFVISGYLPDYRSYINVTRTASFLTDIIIFSVTADNEGNLGKCCLGAHHYQQAREAQAASIRKLDDAEHFENKKLKLWVSLGGAGRSDALPRVASDPTRRKRLITSLIALCQREGLDGVDFDWESPQSDKESKDYFVLLTEASNALHDAGLLVAVALHPHQIFPKHVFDAVDRVHLMTYDMVAIGSHHATAGKMQHAVQALLEGGCASNKVVVGIPAYARHGQNPGSVKMFSECFDEMESPSVKDINKGLWKGYYYDSPKLIRHKVSWAAKQKLAGVFFWELGQDKQHETWGPGGILLKSAYKQKMKLSKAVKDSSKTHDEEL